MSEEGVYRRTPSPGLVAMRNERKLLFSVRRQIGELQKRAAFAEARATSRRRHNGGIGDADVDEIKRILKSTQDQIDELMQGVVGLGPAEDCRKALRQVSHKLASIQGA